MKVSDFSYLAALVVLTSMLAGCASLSFRLVEFQSGTPVAESAPDTPEPAPADSVDKTEGSSGGE